MSSEDRIKGYMVNVQSELITVISAVDRGVPEQERRIRVCALLNQAQRSVTDACAELYRKPGCLVGEGS